MTEQERIAILEQQNVELAAALAKWDAVRRLSGGVYGDPETGDRDWDSLDLPMGPYSEILAAYDFRVRAVEVEKTEALMLAMFLGVLQRDTLRGIQDPIAAPGLITAIHTHDAAVRKPLLESFRKIETWLSAKEDESGKIRIEVEDILYNKYNDDGSERK